MVESFCWRSFVEEQSFKDSADWIGGFRKLDEVLLVAGWTLGNNPEECYLADANRGVRVIQIQELAWTEPAIPPTRIFFKLAPDGSVSLLYIEEDR